LLARSLVPVAAPCVDSRDEVSITDFVVRCGNWDCPDFPVLQESPLRFLEGEGAGRFIECERRCRSLTPPH
jgi:hypothetical protein